MPSADIGRWQRPRTAPHTKQGKRSDAARMADGTRDYSDAQYLRVCSPQARPTLLPALFRLHRKLTSTTRASRLLWANHCPADIGIEDSQSEYSPRSCKGE